MKKRLMLALLLLTCSGTAALAQVGGLDAKDAIRRGNERYNRGEYEAAIREYREVTWAKGALYALALYNIGVCDFELGRTDEAIRMYRRAADARGGRYPKALYALGVALESSGRRADAKAAYRQAIATSDGTYTEARLAVAHYKLGLLNAYEGDYEGAAALFREALARSKDRFPAAHNNLGVMLALAGRTAEAAPEFEIALRQSDAGFGEAAHNLELCRALLSDRTRTALAKAVAAAHFVLTPYVKGG